jgi:hypothetical protein
MTSFYREEVLDNKEKEREWSYTPLSLKKENFLFF